MEVKRTCINKLNCLSQNLNKDAALDEEEQLSKKFGANPPGMKYYILVWVPEAGESCTAVLVADVLLPTQLPYLRNWYFDGEDWDWVQLGCCKGKVVKCSRTRIWVGLILRKANRHIWSYISQYQGPARAALPRAFFDVRP